MHTQSRSPSAFYKSQLISHARTLAPRTIKRRPSIKPALRWLACLVVGAVAVFGGAVWCLS